MAGPAESTIIEDLVRLGAEGDRRAQDSLLNLYWPLIRKVVRARKNRLGHELRMREETQDLEQDVAMELLQSLPRQQWQGSTAFAAWVRKLADYQVIDAHRYHRRKKRDRRAETAAENIQLQAVVRNSAESQVDDGRRVEALVAQIAELKEEYGAALIMNYQGYTHAQIGEALACTAEAARKLVSRARAKLTTQGKSEAPSELKR